MTDSNQSCASCKRTIINLSNKICEHCKRFVSTDGIKKGDIVIYAPNRASMLRGITDNAYIDFGFQPGLQLTVKCVEVEDGFEFILANENDIRFSPFELIPVEEASSKIMGDLISLYNDLKV